MNVHFLIQILILYLSTVNEENCELWEDCYCECYNDTDGDGIYDEDEENVLIEGAI